MKALLLAPMGSVHRQFNYLNIIALKSLNYEVHLLANFEQGENREKNNDVYYKECLKKGIIAHSLPYQRHSISQNIKLIKPTKELIDSEGFDLIHAHTETGGLILRLVGKTKGKKIYTAHGMSFYKGAPLKAQLIYKPIERWICAGMDVNIAINQEEYNALKKWDARKAAFVHGIGLDVEKYKTRTKSRELIRTELGIPGDVKVVLSVGELDDNKNHMVVINALKQIPDAYYVICGVGPNAEKLRNAGLGNRLILAGYRGDIPDVIGACDLFAFPSKHEGLPVSVMEAMAGGLPVVCSKIRGNVDIVENGKSGFLVEPDDIAGWEHALNGVLNSGMMCNSFVNEGYTRIQQYTRESVRKELTELYKGQMENRYV